MKRFLLATMVSGFVFAATPSLAWEVYATLVLNSNGAKSHVLSTSSVIELIVHRVDVTA